MEEELTKAVKERRDKSNLRAVSDAFWNAAACGDALGAFDALVQPASSDTGAAALAFKPTQCSDGISVRSVAVDAFTAAVAHNDASSASRAAHAMGCAGLSSICNSCLFEGAVRATCAYARSLVSSTELCSRLEQALDGARSASMIVTSALPPANAPAPPHVCARLEQAATEEVGFARLEQVFEHIVDFPDSHGALSDLRGCIENAGMRKHACSCVRSKLESRLLHAGASTSAVLSVYVGVQRALRVADPTGAVARAGAQPVEAYLRRRQDAHKQLVEALLHGPSDELGEMLEHELTQTNRLASHSVQSGGQRNIGDTTPRLHQLSGEVTALGDPGKEGSEDWQPPPWEIASQGLLVTQANDGVNDDLNHDGAAMIPSLASISAFDGVEETEQCHGIDFAENALELESDALTVVAGSSRKKSEGIVSELQRAIAERALRGKGNWSTERELQAVELLRIRLGESTMGSCEVMMKDLGDSPRYASACSCPDWFEPMVVSEHFWPPLRDECPQLQLPKEVDDAVENMCNEYKRLKAPRRLLRKPSVGFATVEVGGNEFIVPPIQAAAIKLFENRQPFEHLTTDDVARALNVHAKAAQHALNAWVDRKVLARMHRDSYSVSTSMVSEQSPMQHDEEQHMETGSVDITRDQEREEDDDDGGEADGEYEKEKEEEEEELMVERYVVGMLTNHGALHLDKVHNMLKIFVEGGYNGTRDALKATLDRLVNQGKLTKDSSGAYRKTQKAE